MLARLKLVICAIILLPGLGHSAPNVGGSMMVTNNRVGTVVVFSGAAKATIGTGLFGGRLGLTLGVDVSTGSTQVNVNSIVISGDARVGGNVVVSGNHVDKAYVIGGSANLNSVVLGR